MTSFYSTTINKNIYKKSSTKSEITSQILFGEKFKIILKKKKWIKIKTKSDNYIGFIKNNNFSKELIDTHKCINLKNKVFKLNKSKKFVSKKIFLSFNSRICARKNKNNFIEYQKNKWIKKKDLKPVNHKESNFIKILKKFNGVKYVWGGRTYNGIDCSALIQLYYLYNNKYFPRDTKDQINFKKGKKSLKKFEKGNIIYWKGHVAICISSKKLIHAYGPMKKVIVMNTKSTIEKIYKTAKLKIKKITEI